MWMRNIQMGITSIAIALLGVYTKDGMLVAEKGFFHGYNSQVWWWRKGRWSKRAQQ